MSVREGALGGGALDPAVGLGVRLGRRYAQARRHGQGRAVCMLVAAVGVDLNQRPLKGWRSPELETRR
eukprot:1478633-Pleurochrysis_carterae.AAC.1